MIASARLAVLLVLLPASACVLLVKHVEVEATDDRPTDPAPVESPVRAFLADGSIVVYPDGLTIVGNDIVGAGTRYDVTLRDSASVSAVSLDRVVGMESFRTRTDPGLSLLASVGVTTLAIGGTIALACAADPKCFGSCPTVYSGDGEGEVLEAEAFSYSIAPLLEGRDLDRLDAGADADGRLRLDIRNEALETHFINQLVLQEVRHGLDEAVYPDASGLPVTVGTLRPVGEPRDRSGRDVGASVAEADGEAFATREERLASVTPEDFEDWIDLTLPAVDADSVALFLRLRNSLLNTVLFYDLMLAAQGARALDWLGRDIDRIGTAVELGYWYRRIMGLRLGVESGGEYVEVTRLADSGPIAWKEVALRVPTRPGHPTRVRLSFLADQWRIDRMGWAGYSESRDTRRIGLATWRRPDGQEDPGALPLMAEPDEKYFVTTAGTAFEATFDVGPEPEEGTRTFLLASQGYYTEWVRPDWVRRAGPPRAFEPSEGTLMALMERWREVKAPMEEGFHRTRIPVR